MDHEINIDFIRVLEQIREHERTAVKLKCAWNSLLNVSKLPPEVLGNIFRWNVTLRGDFDGLDKGSHNFLFFSRHWFEVALRTPELWSFRGNTPKDWARWCNYSRIAPFDLVLDGYEYDDDHLNPTLCSIPWDQATQDTIRHVHLIAEEPELLSFIVAQLTTNHEELRSNSMESFILWSRDITLVDVPDFFVHYRFQKLQRLHLSGCEISPQSWDYLCEPSRSSKVTTRLRIRPRVPRG